MDANFDVSQISVLVESVMSATNFRNSKVVQLKFKTNDDLDNALKLD